MYRTSLSGSKPPLRAGRKFLRSEISVLHENIRLSFHHKCSATPKMREIRFRMGSPELPNPQLVERVSLPSPRTPPSQRLGGWALHANPMFSDFNIEAECLHGRCRWWCPTDSMVYYRSIGPYLLIVNLLFKSKLHYFNLVWICCTTSCTTCCMTCCLLWICCGFVVHLVVRNRFTANRSSGVWALVSDT